MPIEWSVQLADDDPAVLSLLRELQLCDRLNVFFSVNNGDYGKVINDEDGSEIHDAIECNTATGRVLAFVCGEDGRPLRRSDGSGPRTRHTYYDSIHFEPDDAN